MSAEAARPYDGPRGRGRGGPYEPGWNKNLPPKPEPVKKGRGQGGPMEPSKK